MKSTFRLHLASGDVEELTLIEVKPLTPAGAGVAREDPFSAVFRGGPGSPADQKIYTLENEDLGRMELFLVPIGPDEVGMRYEAIFN